MNDDATAFNATKMKQESLLEEYGYSSSIDDDPPFLGRLWGGCEDPHVSLESNEYYTPDGIGLIWCNGYDKPFQNLADMASKFGLEVNSTVSVLPDVTTMLTWAELATKEEKISSAIVNTEATSLS
jgi:hypothetical protein